MPFFPLPRLTQGAKPGLGLARFRHLSIGHKLNLGFGTLVVLMFLVVGRNYVNTLRANGSLYRTQTERVPTALTSAQAQKDLLWMMAALRGYLATGDSSFRDRYHESRQTFELSLMEMETLLEGAPAQAAQLRELEALYSTWAGLSEQLFQLQSQPLENQPALGLLEDQGQLPIRLVLQESEALVARLRERGQGDMAQEVGAFQSSFALMVAGLKIYVASRDPTAFYDYYEYLQANQEAWGRLQQRRPQLSDADQARLDAIATHRAQLLDLPDRLFQIVQSPRRRQDLYIFNTEAEPLTEEMLGLLNEIVEVEQTLLRRELGASQQAGRRAQLQSLALGVFALGVAVLMVLVLRRQISARIQRLMHATETLKSGNFQAAAPEDSTDEIGALALAFNHMTDSLRLSHETLESYSHTLEKRVAERTEELQQKNQQLETLLRDLKQTQSQLIQTEKMSSLGQMVAGVAHEINNPVNFIYGNLHHAETYIHTLLELLEGYRRELPQPSAALQAHEQEADVEFLLEDLPKVLASMQLGASRIREIVLTLRNFARVDEAEMKLTNLHHGLDSTLMLLQGRLRGGKAVQVRKDYGELPLVPCYPGQLNQVFMNILINAIDALEEEPPPHPTITLTTRYHHQRATITIADNGPGMGAAVQRQLFDPFFTTKPVGQGTGLGLSISYQLVVKNHGGRLHCLSEPGRGSVFYIEIPVPEMAAATPEPGKF